MTIKYLLKKRCAVVLLNLMMASVCAQGDALAALQKIYCAYNSSTVIHFTGTMKMYDKKVPAKMMDRMQSSYIIKKGNFSCSIGPVSMLLNDNYYVSADNNDKVIIIGRKKDLQAAASTPVLNLGQLKSRVASNNIKAVVLVKGPVSIVQLTDTDGSSGFVASTIEFNTATGYMKKVLLETVDFSKEAGKTIVLEINYTEPVQVPAGEYLFSERPFFSVVGNKIQLAAAYKNYKIIGQL